MQSSTLKENQNSDLISAYMSLLPKNAPKKVLVYVESHEDIAFWHGILKSYETTKLQFDIQLPSQMSLAKGKNQALEHSKDILTLGVGQHLIICIDSDYDYLLQDKTVQSKLINENPFIFQTYAYSIENLRCFSGDLDHICVQASNMDNNKIDFEELLKLYSNITYPLFLWSVFFKYPNQYSTMTLSEFCNIIRFQGTVNINEQGKTHLERLRKEVTHQVEKLEKEFSNEVEKVTNFRESLTQLGVNEDNTYLFIQGHTIEEGVVLVFLKSLTDVLRNEKVRKIMTQAKHEDEKAIEQNHYRNSLIEVEKALKSNTEYKSCFLYEKIKVDLDAYCSTIQ